MLQPSNAALRHLPARLTPAAVLRRFALSGLSATLALTASALAGDALSAQGSVRRPTVPVVPVARVVTRDGSRPAAKPAVKPAAGKPAAKPANKPASVAAKPKLARPVVDTPAVRDTNATLVDAAPVTGEATGEVAAPARSAGYTRYRSTRDSVAGESARAGAERSTGVRVVVQLDARELAVLDGADTLLVAPVAIGRDTTIKYGARTWSFDTPRGKRTVQRKNENPVWIPPDWHYVEVAARKGLKLGYLPANGSVALGGGRKLVVRSGLAGVLDGRAFTALPTDEELVFGNTLYVPPLGSKNRAIEGELGRFRLDLGNGYQLHGTPHEDTIGDAATHGCIRLYDEDIEWLYQHVPVGTSVYIF